MGDAHAFSPPRGSQADAVVRVEGETTQEVTLDGFFGGRFFAFQSRRGPRASIDALFLAAAVPEAAGAPTRYLEAGAGSGVAALALASRGAHHFVTAVEHEPSQLELLARNIRKNGLGGRILPVAADITASAARLAQAGLKAGQYDHVLANPPYFVRGRVRVPPEPARARAHSAPAGDLGRWIRFLTQMCAPGGTLTLVFHPEGLAQLLTLLAGRFGGVVVFPLFPHVGKPARRLLVQGRKGSRAPLRLMPGMVLHQEDGSFTPRAEAVLRRGHALKLTAE